MDNRLKEKVFADIKNSPTSWAIPYIEQLEEKEKHLAFRWVSILVDMQFELYHENTEDIKKYIDMIDDIRWGRNKIDAKYAIELARALFRLNDGVGMCISNLSQLFTCESYFILGDIKKYIRNLNYLMLFINMDLENNVFLEHPKEAFLKIFDIYENLLI